jgi:DNA-binding CsgD family transcriptional regulator
MQSLEPTKEFPTSEPDRLWVILEGITPRLWSHEIRNEPMQIGRAESCEIILDNFKVSRNHAILQRQGTTVLLKDCDSRNGTFIQGLRVTEAMLERGTVFRVGDIDLVIADQTMLSQEIANVFGKSTFIDDAPESARDTIRAYKEQRQRAIGILSSSQKRVLRLVLNGLAEKEIAASLFISPDTVHSHMKSIYKSFQVNSRAELLSRFVDPAARNLL